MAWEIRNVGWPVPYGDTWPVTQRQSNPQEQLHTSPTQHKIEVYGYDWFSVESYRGRVVNTWS